MLAEHEHTLRSPLREGTREGNGGGRHPRGWSIGRLILWGAGLSLLTLVVAFVLSGVMAWRWVDHNVLHWGLQDAGTKTVNQTALLQRVRGFELVTVKDTYDSQVHVGVTDVFNAGSTHVTLPGWVAGQALQVKGTVIVTAGVDLAKVGSDDMRVTRHGKDTSVLIRVPAPEITSSELVPNTLRMSTSAGILTQIGQALGLNQESMRNRAADEVIRSARQQAQQQGILDEASHEAERRLQAFLQSLPQNGGHVTYTVISNSAPTR